MVEPSPTCSGVDTLGTLFGARKLLTSSLSNLILGVDSGVALSVLLIQSLFSSLSFLVIVSLIHRSVFYPECLVQASKNFHFCSALPLSRFESDLRLQSRRSGRIFIRPKGWLFVIFHNAGCSRICPTWFCSLVSLPSLLCCELRNKFQYFTQLWHCSFEVISHISKYSVFSMLLIMSFDFSLNALNA